VLIWLNALFVLFINQYVVWSSWIVSIVLIFGTLFSAWWFYKPNYKYDAFVAALYGALYRITWAAGVSWTIIAVSTGNGGENNTYILLYLVFARQSPYLSLLWIIDYRSRGRRPYTLWINSFLMSPHISCTIGFIEPILCWKPVITLSRLTYCAFLCHGGLQLYTVGSIRTPFHASIYNLVNISDNNWYHLIIIILYSTRSLKIFRDSLLNYYCYRHCRCGCRLETSPYRSWRLSVWHYSTNRP